MNQSDDPLMVVFKDRNVSEKTFPEFYRKIGQAYKYFDSFKPPRGNRGSAFYEDKDKVIFLPSPLLPL